MFVHGILLFPSNLNRHPKQRYQGFGCLPRQKTALFNLQTHPGRILLHRLARHDDYPARDTSPILIASHQKKSSIAAGQGMGVPAAPRSR